VLYLSEFIFEFETFVPKKMLDDFFLCCRWLMNIQEELTSFEIFQTLFDFCILLAFVVFVKLLLKSVPGDGQAEDVSSVQAVPAGQTPRSTYSESWINPFWRNREAAPEQQEEDQESNPATGLSNDEISIQIHRTPHGVIVDDAEMGYDTVH
jgi:hypothetical protein